MKRMSVYMMPNPRKYYFLHPVQYFRDRTMCRRLALERGWLGFCESDVVEFSEWFCSVIPQILRTMMATPESRPGGIRRFDTPEKWQTWLNRVANGIEQGSASYAASDPRNEYRERYEEAYSKALAEEVCARCESGCFNECMEDGKWCGDSVAVKELEAKCAQAQEKMDSENAEKAKKTVSWNAFAGMGEKRDADGIDALLDFATK